ncbi:hypothetical protein P7K49_024653, partial [Saguinus oedipus]
MSEESTHRHPAHGSAKTGGEHSTRQDSSMGTVWRPSRRPHPSCAEGSQAVVASCGLALGITVCGDLHPEEEAAAVPEAP